MRSTSPFTPDAELEFAPAGSGSRTVLCSMKDGHGHLWFGNADGTLTRCTPGSRRFEDIELRDGDGFLNKSAVWSLLADKARGIGRCGRQAASPVSDTSPGRDCRWRYMAGHCLPGNRQV